MGCPAEVRIGDNLTFSVSTKNLSTSVATDADAVPAYRIYEDDTATPILTGNMALLDAANTTGLYVETVACTAANGFEEGKSYTVYVSWAVSSAAATETFGFRALGAADDTPTSSLSSEVAICNAALMELGANAITALTDDNNAARLCNRFYAQTRDEMIDRVKPNFAKERVDLAALTSTPAFGYTYEYQLPSDFLRTLTTDDDTESLGFKIEGRALLTDSDAVSLRYLKRITDTNKFSPKFAAALVAAMKAKLAYPITRSVSLKQICDQEYETALEEAQAAEGQEDSVEIIRSDTLRSVR